MGKVLTDEGLNLVDTNEVYSDDEDVSFLDIDSKIEENIIQNMNFYKSYKEIYFITFNSLKTCFHKKRINYEAIFSSPI